MLKVGTIAPDFKLQAHSGDMVQLSAFRGQKNVVLFFYPKDDTTGCTKEACAFRDSYADFTNRDTVVLGISSDDEGSHTRFAGKYGLPFPLLSDVNGKVRTQYQVGRTLGLLPGRVTFVIDKQGVIRTAFSSQFQPEEHMRTALQGLS